MDAPDSHLHSHSHSPLPRLFLTDSAYLFVLKTDSQRLFCYHILAGDTGYHRISQGEVYLSNGQEHLCVPCAQRRGLFRHEPIPLRAPLIPDPSPTNADPNADALKAKVWDREWDLDPDAELQLQNDNENENESSRNHLRDDSSDPQPLPHRSRPAQPKRDRGGWDDQGWGDW